MSNSFRDRARFGDRFRDKSGDEILQSLRQQLDQDKKMFFDSTPAWGESTSTKSPFARAGFPFDDFEDSRAPRSSRLQKHLDELASRHPEFADHLRPDLSGGFRTWGPRNRRGSGGSGGTGVFSSEDDDNRSQVSGCSNEGATSTQQATAQEMTEGPEKMNKLPQYGLRNTVGDLGGAAQKLEQSERNQRSWSAPPDARSSEPNQPKRFVSRIEIQPKIPGAQPVPQQQPPSPPTYSSSPGKPPMGPSKPQQPSKPASNVRHIPIFVEGRDEPVIAKDVADSPAGAAASAHASAHAEHFAPEFSNSFPDRGFVDQTFSDHPFADRFTRPQFTNTFHPFRQPHQQHNFRTHGQQQSSQKQPQQQQQTQQQEKQSNSSSQQQQQQTSQKRPTASQPPPTKRPTDAPAKPPANDPLSKVAAVQKDVDAILEDVKQFSGNSRSDKQYIYLDEMLTRNLIRLDDIETEGKENIRQARKDTIRSIQRAISLLESKAPINAPSKTEGGEEEEVPMDAEETGPKAMDTQESPAIGEDHSQMEATVAAAADPPSQTAAAVEEQPAPPQNQANESAGSTETKMEEDATPVEGDSAASASDNNAPPVNEITGQNSS